MAIEWQIQMAPAPKIAYRTFGDPQSSIFWATYPAPPTERQQIGVNVVAYCDDAAMAEQIAGVMESWRAHLNAQLEALSNGKYCETRINQVAVDCVDHAEAVAVAQFLVDCTAGNRAAAIEFRDARRSELTAPNP